MEELLFKNFLMKRSKMLTLKSLQYARSSELNEPSYKSYLKCVAKILQLAIKGWVHLRAALLGSSEIRRKGTMLLEENNKSHLIFSPTAFKHNL